MKILLFMALAWGERYSHAPHQAKAPVECKSCHTLSPGNYAPLPVGANDHKPCIDCHGGAEFARGSRCLTCHSSVKTMKPGKPWFPPWRSPGEFHVGFDHKKHAQAQACEKCHSEIGGTLSSGHGMCARCHAQGTLPDMNFCGGCHKLGVAQPTVKAPPGPYEIAFSHPNHARAAGKLACNSCHTGNDRPPMARCDSCHDGKKAFATSAKCSRCHKDGPRTNVAPADFMHTGKHVAACETCHDPSGRADHRGCVKCHDFGKRGASVCGSCHARNDPLPPNPVRPVEKHEFASQMKHPPHLKDRTCAQCHAPITGGTKPDGHALCGACHKKTPPTMDACVQCHLPSAAKEKRPWSVAARFKHDQNHRGSCETCHLAGADLAPPTMRGCANCHDGAKAFKATGHGCARCHSR